MGSKAKAAAGMAGLLLCAAGWAGAPNPMAPGQWETSREMTVNGKAQPAAVSSACVDKAKADGFALWEPSAKLPVAEAVSCKVEGYAMSGAKASWRSVCKMRDGGEATVSVENSASRDLAVFSSAIDAGDEKGAYKRMMSVKLTMRRLGDCAAK